MPYDLDRDAVDCAMLLALPISARAAADTIRLYLRNAHAAGQNAGLQQALEGAKVSLAKVQALTYDTGADIPGGGAA